MRDDQSTISGGFVPVNSISICVITSTIFNTVCRNTGTHRTCLSSTVTNLSQDSFVNYERGLVTYISKVEESEELTACYDKESAALFQASNLDSALQLQFYPLRRPSLPQDSSLPQN